MLLTLYVGFYRRLGGDCSVCYLSLGEGGLWMSLDLLKEYAYGCF